MGGGGYGMGMGMGMGGYGMGMGASAYGSGRMVGNRAAGGGVSQQQLNRLFVGGLNDSVSDQQLQAHFAQFGEVSDCYIPKEKTGKQRGYGCVLWWYSEGAVYNLLSF